ncbi:reverse transcriptase domain-containing protein [Tanacetum coccineum]
MCYDDQSVRHASCFRLRRGVTGRQTGRGGGRTRKQTGRSGGRTGDQGGRGNGANGGIDEVPKFATVIAQQLQDLLPTIVAQVGDHVSNQGNIRSQNDNAVDDSIHEDDRNANVGNGMSGCSYKDFVACKPKEFDGKGCAVAYIRWVKKMEAIQDIGGCKDNQKVKYSAGSLTGRALKWWNFEVRTRGHEAAVGMTCEYFKALMKEEYYPSNEMQKLETELWNYAMVEAGHSAYTDRFRKLARLVPHLVTLETKRIERYIYGLAPQIRRMVAPTKPPMIQNAILKAGVLTDEAVRNGSLKRNGRESSKEGNVKGDNKRARTGKVFATITKPVRKDYTGLTPKCTNWNFHHNPKMPCRMCTNFNRLGHFAKDCKTGPRIMNPLNAGNPTAARGACFECGGTDHYKSACPTLNRAPGQGGNHPNQAMAIEGGQGRGNNGNPACGRAFMMGAEEARQDPNIVMGMFFLNNHYATMLFDSGAGYSFVSTTFVPLLDIDPSSLGSWSDSGEEDDEKVKDETCLVAHASSEVCSESSYFSDENSSIDDLALDNEYDKKVKESLNVTFDETPPPSKTSPLVDDDLDEEEAIKVTEKKNLENDIVDETLEIDKIVNIKESMNHPLENVIGNLNQRTLRSQAQNQSNFFCFISTIEPKNVNEALGDESWIVAMQEELNQFVANDVWELVP